MAKNKHGEENLKGTLYMVFAVGFVIIGVWAYCFSLFADRFKKNHGGKKSCTYISMRNGGLFLV